MKSKVEEKHISVTKEIHDKLKHIAKKQNRTMRGVVSMWVEKEMENGNKS